MASILVRTIETHERDEVLDLLAHWLDDRGFFARYFRHDPSFRDDLCFVAEDSGHIVSTLQVFRKRVRFGAAALEVAGVGNVYTADSHRGRGLASELLERAVAAMPEHGFDLSLLFASRIDFYARLGWHSHLRRLTFIDPGASGGAGAPAIDLFDAERDLGGVMAVYDRHSGDLSGTTLRDRAYWLGQLRYAGNPGETFLVFRDGGEVVAYARSTDLYDFHVVTEHGCVPGRQAALADLIAALHARASSSPGTLAQTCYDPALEDELRARGLSLRSIDDPTWMWRVVDPERVAAKLGIRGAEAVAPQLFAQLLPPERSVYWIADRF
jgi:predicted N-acetyltransferase YhbS